MIILLCIFRIPMFDCAFMAHWIIGLNLCLNRQRCNIFFFSSERESDRHELQSQIDNLAKQSAEERDQLRQQLQDEKTDRETETKALRDFFG